MSEFREPSRKMRVPGFHQQKTDPIIQAPNYAGPDRRMAKARKTPWKTVALILGSAAATLTITGAVVSFLQPSIVAAMKLESKETHDADIKALNTRIDKMFTSVDNKLDILVARKP